MDTKKKTSLNFLCSSFGAEKQIHQSAAEQQHTQKMFTAEKTATSISNNNKKCRLNKYK